MRSASSRSPCTRRSANTEYRHPLLTRRDDGQARRRRRHHDRQGALRRPQHEPAAPGAERSTRSGPAKGIEVEYCTIGSKGFGFVSRMGGKVVSQVVNYGDRPALERLIGPVKMLIDGYLEGRIDEVHLFSNRFVNTMKQDPMHATIIPIPQDVEPLRSGRKSSMSGSTSGNWDYLYEPDAKTVLDELLVRYIETFVYQAAADNIASEQSARMVAMKAASDNAQTSSRSCSSSTTRAARLRSRRNSRRSSAARRRSSGSHSTIQNSRFIQEANMAQVQGTIVQMHRRGHRRRVPARGDAEGLRRARRRGQRQPAGREGPDARSRAAARRRRRAHDRDGLLRRPAARHEGAQHRRRASRCRSVPACSGA